MQLQVGTLETVPVALGSCHKRRASRHVFARKDFVCREDAQDRLRVESNILRASAVDLARQTIIIPNFQLPGLENIGHCILFATYLPGHWT